ncbi:chemotaxis protein histidine kinase CheA [Burkholderia ambifaria]|nr:chemotaxis protein histidine kinase CheA [Burkholderia ambifaria]
MKKYLGAVKTVGKSKDAHASETAPALSDASETARQLASVLTSKALKHRARVAMERERDAFVKAAVDKAEGELQWDVFKNVENEWGKALTNAGFRDIDMSKVPQLYQEVSRSVSNADYLALIAAHARASWDSGQALDAKPEATAKSAVYEAAHDATGRAVEGKVEEMGRAAEKEIQRERDAATKQKADEIRRKAEEETRQLRESADQARRRTDEAVQRRAEEENQRLREFADQARRRTDEAVQRRAEEEARQLRELAAQAAQRKAEEIRRTAEETRRRLEESADQAASSGRHSWIEDDRRSINSTVSRDTLADRFREMEAGIARESGFRVPAYGWREYQDLKDLARRMDTETKAADPRSFEED